MHGSVRAILQGTRRAVGSIRGPAEAAGLFEGGRAQHRLHGGPVDDPGRNPVVGGRATVLVEQWVRVVLRAGVGINRRESVAARSIPVPEGEGERIVSYELAED